ncbi:methylmalonyl-CoA mutase family protein [Aureispira anguillae]|uniref:Methylmalonyl-CoA mutase family protein n=1 Tax=Aureispira anguillae TaxID=2864201 RepID=A0A915YM40_9BACT|nr:methylmalonyl-CoA mutase family protein [Aureispira anguillae]BDS15442.1 methylmalonyl-CoA mutase family protein [Aureispira anguillae]
MTKEITNMEHTQNLFQEFEAVTTEDWLAAIEKFLKGKPVDSLNWEIEDELVISPVHRQATTTTQYLGSADLAINNNWNICEAFLIQTPSDYSTVNQLILDALSKGANALILNFEHFPSLNELSLLLKGVLLDLVHIHFKGAALLSNTKVFLEHLAQITNAQALNGSCDFGNITKEELLLCSDFCATAIPNLKLITIAIPNSSSTSLSQAIDTANQWILFLLDKGMNIEQVTHLLRFEFNIGEHYFVELSSIRAFKRLWLGLLEAYQAPKALFPTLHASTLSDQHENQYWNMITATTQAMASAIAGVNSIYVRPCSGLNQADDFTRRIARNVQHLLQSESYLNRVIDPASGAYYIENLTAALTKKAWQQFCEL